MYSERNDSSSPCGTYEAPSDVIVSKVPWLRSPALPANLASALDEAMRLGNAELVIETSKGRAGIHATRGAIAWVAGARSDATFSTVLSERTSLSRDAMRDVYRRCRDTGSNFAETLILEGLARREDVRGALLTHHARQLGQLVDDGIVRVVVVPRTRVYSSDLLFSLEELVGARAGEGCPDATHHSESGRGGTERESYDMADIKKSLDDVMKIDGAIACALADWESGLTLGTSGGGGFDIELAASGNTDVVRAKVAVMRALKIDGPIEDILITLATQYHLIRPLATARSLFLYVAIDRQKGNLGLARHRLRQIEETLEF